MKKVSEHSSHSSDLASSDYNLYPRLQVFLAETNTEVTLNLKKQLVDGSATQPKEMCK